MCKKSLIEKTNQANNIIVNCEEISQYLINIRKDKQNLSGLKLKEGEIITHQWYRMRGE